MKFIKEYIRKHKERQKQIEEDKKKEQQQITMNKYKEKYEARHVLISGGHKGKVCGVKVWKSDSHHFNYICIITHLYVMVDRRIYKIGIDNIIGVENKS